MNVLFFCPTPENSNAEQVLRILHDSAIPTDKLNILSFDENSPSSSFQQKDFDAVIILYTPAVELSSILFEVVRNIDQKKPAGRFIFLPKTDGKEIIPPIFHPIRALQLQLIYYSLSGQAPHDLGAHLVAFKDDWKKFINPIPVDGHGSRGKAVGRNPVGFGLILIVSILILFLAGLIAVLIPTAKATLLKPTPTSLHPPAAAAYWLKESFQTIDTTTLWQEKHYYTGQQALQAKLSETGLRLSASPLVNEAVFQLDSLQNWPLDKLQSLSFSFVLSAMQDPNANNILVVGLILSEDDAYHLDCVIIPTGTDGRIQCQIQSPEQNEALTDALPLTLDEKHTATLVFDPLTYTVQFFLDDQYYGQREIRAVEHWRARQFNLQVSDRLENLNAGSFSCELSSLNLAHRP
jgi:hypothetical protein